VTLNKGLNPGPGQNHPDTPTSRNNLAGAYQAAGDLGRAIRSPKRHAAT